MIGRTISHYKILSKLGEGGMGVVYQAEDLKLKRTVALKFLPPELTRDKDAKTRFVHEAQAASALQHHHICTIHEIDETPDGRLFIAMDCYEGETLKEKISRGPLALEEAVDLAIQIGEGLLEAHEAGIVHRDVKPGNILITRKGVVKIVDFGLAKLSGQTKMTKTGATVGTAAYMSPEQARGDEVDFRTDIWSWGVMLYEMLTGRAPFKGEAELALLYSITNQDPETVTVLRPEVPLELERVVMRALEKDPKKRAFSMGEVVESLQGMRVELGLLQTRGKWSLWRMKHRRVVRAAVGVLAAVVVIAAGIEFWPWKAKAIDSVAVLPLVNLSGDPEQEYFVEGMTDELIGQLGKVGALTVISRTSSMQYKKVKKPLPEIARELHVGAIMNGSVRWAGDRVRISLQLVNAKTDKSLWSDTYDMTITDIFAVQTEVAAQVVGALKATLTPGEEERLKVKGPVNPEAYQLYLKGNFYSNKLVEQEIWKAIELYKQALELDPRYAPAYSGLARAYQVLPIYGHVSPKETYPKQREYAMKAVALDESSAPPHIALGNLASYDWNWKAAEKEFKRAIELAPSDRGIRSSYAFFSLYNGRTGEAVVQQTRAVDLDPLNVFGHQNLGEILYYARRYDESIKASLETIEMDPVVPQAHTFLGMAYAAKGMTAEALNALDRDAEISAGKKPEIESWIGVAYGLARQKERARQIYSHMMEQARSEFVSPFPLACICFVVGDIDKGFEWLAQGYEQHDHRMAYLKVHPACDGIRNDPRYIDLVKKIWPEG
jgi:TolB-like protein/tetratricopeptide (TPR) repeat protein/tRNA A-37 threonylcarbamoyl transferase component Bud32